MKHSVPRFVLRFGISRQMRSYALKTFLRQSCSIGTKGVLPMRSCHSVGAQNIKVLKGTDGLSALDIVKEYGIPIQRVSLSRGLALNRFEKDFFIYPEYSDTDAAERMLRLVSALKDDIKIIDHQEDSLMALWEKYKLFSYAVPKKYGGVDMCYKDLLTICEGLGSCWNLYFRFEQTHLAASLILLYGNDLQKSRYLPQIASGVIRPVIGFSRSEMDSNLGSLTSSCELNDDKQKLIASNHFINASDANLLLVFAKQDRNNVACYLIEKKKGDSDIFEMGAKTVFGRNGLNVNWWDFKQMAVEPSLMLGKLEDGKRILQETLVKRITFGAAVTGFMKTLINSLSEYCNGTLQQNVPLSERNSAKLLVTKLALNTYVLESMCYYVGGLHDEELILSLDIEEAVIYKYARHLLSEVVSSTINVTGMDTVLSGMNFDGLLNETMAALLLSSTELDFNNFVASQIIISYANVNANIIKQWRSFDKRFYERIFGHVEKAISFYDPKLQHFIGEHAHPSLKEACTNLEHTMWRLESLLNLLLSHHGKSVISDYSVLGAISKVIEYSFGMVATISRSSRSYSIGLRNGDLEVSWTQLYCSEAANMSMAELRKLYDYFRFERMNSLYSKIGESVLISNGYCIESPITRNCYNSRLPFEFESLLKLSLRRVVGSVDVVCKLTMSKPARDRSAERENIVDSEDDTSPPPPKIKRIGWIEMRHHRKQVDGLSAGDARIRLKIHGDKSNENNKSDGSSESDGSDESVESDKSDGSVESDKSNGSIKSIESYRSEGSVESYRSYGSFESYGSGGSVESVRSYGSDESGSPPAESDRLTPVQQFSFNDSDSSDEMTRSGAGDKDQLKDSNNITDSSNSSIKSPERNNSDGSNDLRERTMSPPSIINSPESTREPRTPCFSQGDRVFTLRRQMAVHSPSDNILSPCTMKLNRPKNFFRMRQAKASSLFSAEELNEENDNIDEVKDAVIDEAEATMVHRMDSDTDIIPDIAPGELADDEVTKTDDKITDRHEDSDNGDENSDPDDEDSDHNDEDSGHDDESSDDDDEGSDHDDEDSDHDDEGSDHDDEDSDHDDEDSDHDDEDSEHDDVDSDHDDEGSNDGESSDDDETSDDDEGSSD
ncbi:unnamed protein product [Litomosoides sigmodontis]|uniref:Uncharacterized protein n=1 Tax=Litomosoides sigmodontis TaxID=42156 RepID=A0A3P6VAG0_LITSI|nr:unnamed protein product [Litomosoides sigmodontis]